MKTEYIIYILIGKEKSIPDGYYTKTITDYKLQEADLGWSHSRHDSMEAALMTIEENKENLKYEKIVILPIYTFELEY